VDTSCSCNSGDRFTSKEDEKASEIPSEVEAANRKESPSNVEEFRWEGLRPKLGEKPAFNKGESLMIIRKPELRPGINRRPSSSEKVAAQWGTSQRPGRRSTSRDHGYHYSKDRMYQQNYNMTTPESITNERESTTRGLTSDMSGRADGEVSAWDGKEFDFHPH
jgi:hypothetical protein